jgi:hypothetical protein
MHFYKLQHSLMIVCYLLENKSDQYQGFFYFKLKEMVRKRLESE